MNTLQDARGNLDAARKRHAQSVERLANARQQLESIRDRAIAGTVASGELAAARDAIEAAELAVVGTEAPLEGLEQAVRDAEATEECERISQALRALGANVSRTLEAVDRALNEWALASAAYDTFVTSESNTLRTRCIRSQRFSAGPGWKHHTIDGIRTGPSKPMSQLAGVLLPAAKIVGAGQTILESLKEMAQGAPILPTSDR